MTTTKPKRAKGRRSSTSELDAMILSTGLQLVAARGLDETSAVLLADAVGTSVGPIYSRYDSMEDLGVEIWRTGLSEHFACLLEDLRASCDGDLEARGRLAQQMAAPDEATSALVELLAVARRYSFLREVVADDASVHLDRHLAAQPECPRALALAQVQILLGAVLLAPVGAAMSVDDHLNVLEMLAEATHDPEAARATPLRPEPAIFDLPKGDTHDELLDAFVDAVIEVIAQVGYDKASANRIARRAGHGFSSIYSHYESKEEFMEATVNLLIDQIITQSVQGFIGVTREEFIANSVANALGLSSEQNRLNRHLRTEVILAARHHLVISDHLNAAYELVIAFGREAYAQQFPTFTDEHTPILRAKWLLVRSNGFGMSLLRSNTPMAAEIDWTPASIALRNLTERRLLDLL